MMSSRTRTKIRAPRRGLAAKDEDVDFEAIWAILATSLREIHTKNASKLSFEELYRNAYKLVLKKQGDELYTRVRDLEAAWLRDEVRLRINELVTPSIVLSPQGVGPEVTERTATGEKFLKGIKQAWEDHGLCMSMITDVLMYMDRVYLSDQRRPSIFTTAMGLFRQHVLTSPIDPEHSDITVLGVFLNIVLDMVRCEREGEIIDRSLVRSCMYMLEGLYETETEEEDSKLYLRQFEPKFLEESRIFYANEGQTLLANTDASTFCKHTKLRIREEEERCQQTISTVSEPKIKAIIDDELIRKYIRDIIALEGSGVKHMLDNDRLADLADMYELNARVDSKKDALKKAVQKRVVELGSEINSAAAEMISQTPAGQSKSEARTGTEAGSKEKPVNQQTLAAIKWVEDILQLKSRYDNIWEQAFKKDPTMEKALEASFQEFINSNTRSPEYLSLFLDQNLKSNQKGKTETEVDTMLDKGIVLLQYLTDKDHFETYYKKHLSRRLLMKRSQSMDSERLMISKMKMKVGNTFTQRLEAMFKDMALSEDITSKYRVHVSGLGDKDPKRIDLDISVLTSTMWPVEIMGRPDEDGVSRNTCTVPPLLDRLMKGFEKFYLKDHTGRKLTWQMNMGTADLRITFNNQDGKQRKHDVNVSTYAMVILLLFQDLPASESLSFEEIQARTNIPTSELTRNLQSLAVANKTRILMKHPMSKDVKPTDRFSFNENFQGQYLKFKVGVVSSGSNKVENIDERRETERKANEERGGAIEAAVVRIMKQRKKLSHQHLLTETIQQLANRFQPDVNMVKKRIESLIDREYLERDNEAPAPSYNYLA